MRRNLRPPIQEFSKLNNGNINSQTPPNQNLPKNNINKNDIKTPFSTTRAGPQFISPNQQNTSKERTN
jgi:hypothetical protein